MKCPNCNHPIDDSLKFCPECGTKLSNNQSQTEAKAETIPTKGKRKMKLFLIIGIAAAIIVATVLFCVFFFRPSCEHEWVTEYFDPTCGDYGYSIHTCTKCELSEEEHYYDEANEPTGQHNWEMSSDRSNKTCSKCQLTKETTAREALNEDEIEVYRALSNFSKNLKSPSSLTLLDIRVGKISATGTEENVFVKVSATNSFGGIVTDVYVCNGYNLDIGGSSWYNVAGAWPHIGSVRKINAALQDDFKSLSGQ